MIDSTDAKIGRSMKNRENMTISWRPSQERSIGGTGLKESEVPTVSASAGGAGAGWVGSWAWPFAWPFVVVWVWASVGPWAAT